MESMDQRMKQHEVQIVSWKHFPLLLGDSRKQFPRASCIEEPEDLSEKSESSGASDLLCSVDETCSPDFVANYKLKTDLLKAFFIGTFITAGGVAICHPWGLKNQNLVMSLVFFLGYAGIMFEECLAFNKSGVALLMAVTLWTIHSRGASSPDVAVELYKSFEEVSEVIFFLLGAMTIVEIIDAHQGFKLLSDFITVRNPRCLLWVVGGITFVVSSLLDNLTTTIMMVSLLRKLVPDSDKEQRKYMLQHYKLYCNAYNL
ncbi:hypothetical protein O6H91_03G039100 [Diphasiastrum complanatum]|uniref:Uncharacterized protein n=1 Tax=Diphasiastrum complanatum TaxID=34168 RepID=A0ACC2E5C7_DIPCM|nr:hypothetical protein O6H91_03G039100 [Diphasiastrum complanatum]